MDHYESLLSSGAEVIEHARSLQSIACGLRDDSREVTATARAATADSKRVIDLLLDHVLCGPCMIQRAELSHARIIVVWEELTRHFSSARTVAGRCEDCGEEAALLRLVS